MLATLLEVGHSFGVFSTEREIPKCRESAPC
jgi:hypothetical protein